MNALIAFLYTLLGLFIIATWLLGFVIAKGVSAFFCIFPLYSWYVVIEYFWNHVQLC